jgi:exonuclease SbcC
VNDLLLACYGSRFTVEIRTQRELASGEVREGFEILVHDADRDSTKAVGVMSGGQKVWINECLTRGIALYLARNAGQPYRTLFSDESDGPLDPERKLQFMRMKREVLRQGGYEREFFISQTPDLIDEADAILDVAALAV